MQPLSYNCLPWRLAMLSAMFLLVCTRLGAQAPAPVEPAVPAPAQAEATGTAEAQSEPGSPDVPDLADPSREPAGTVLPETIRLLYDFGFELVANRSSLYQLLPGDLLTLAGAGGDQVLLTVKDVRDDRLFLATRWTDRKLAAGDELLPLPRLGVQLEAIAGAVMLLDPSLDGQDFYADLGVRGLWTWGLHGLRPALSLTIPVGPAIDNLLAAAGTGTCLPFMVGAGLEYSFDLGRVQLQPQINSALIFLLPLGTGNFALAGFRTEMILRAAFALDPFAGLFVETGYLYHYLDPDPASVIKHAIRLSVGFSLD